MKEFGLIGYPLTHSFSPAYFQHKFDVEGIAAIYKAFAIKQIDEYRELLLSHPDLSGLNVTIPYKQAVMPLLDELDNAAAAIGAVNCISINEGSAKGYNTDYIGFKQSLTPLLQPHHTHALVLGSGGASKAVVYALQQLGIEYKIVSRANGDISYSDLSRDIISNHHLIINTTPLGMHPDIEQHPLIPYEHLTPQHLLYDLIYNPEETLFLRKAKERGAQIKNGYEMLVLQAEESWKIWNS
ncbi:MAG: shikimate dehydrogenase [Bacteroidetes bacterium]|nr:shikimate dehydrogenase [Bacteroidota bacterium]